MSELTNSPKRKGKSIHNSTAMKYDFRRTFGQAVESTGKCKLGYSFEELCFWCFKLKFLSGSTVDFLLYSRNLFIYEIIEVGLFGNILCEIDDCSQKLCNELLRADRRVVPCFNTFYEYLRDVYREDMQQREIQVTLSDFNINNLLTTLKLYYRGGRYEFLLNSDKNIDLLSKSFIVFEIDQVKDNKDLFPVVTIIIMETFINKMRRLKGISSRKRGRRSPRPIWRTVSSTSTRRCASTLVRLLS